MLEAAPQRAARLYRQCSAGPGRQGAVEGAAGRGRRGCSLGLPTQGLNPVCRFLDPDPHRVSFVSPCRGSSTCPSEPGVPAAGTRRRVSKLASFQSLPYFSSTRSLRGGCLADAASATPSSSPGPLQLPRQQAFRLHRLSCKSKAP